MLILIAEDDANLRRGLCDLLRLEGFDTVAVETGDGAVRAFKQRRPGLCILDVTMPGMDGFEACKAIRGLDADVPVLFLTARTEEIDRILGFGIGADDYIGKPFSSAELVARIKAITRRLKTPAPQAPKDATFLMADLRIDSKALRAFRGSEVLDLTQKELSVLSLLHERAGLAVTRDELYDKCWGWGHFANSRALDQFIAALRRKIEADASSPRIVRTVHGVGYRFDP